MSDERTAEPDEAQAALIVLSETDSADELAAAVGLSPDKAWNRGDKRKVSRLPHKFSGIEYHSRVARTARPAEHLDDLLARLAPIKDRIAALAERLSAQGGEAHLARLSIWHMTSNGTPGYDFSPEQLALISEMGVWFDLSLDFNVDIDCSGE